MFLLKATFLPIQEAPVCKLYAVADFLLSIQCIMLKDEADDVILIIDK